MVYVGSHDNKVYALDAATGEYIWSFTTGDMVVSSPTVVGGVLYVGSYDHLVYALGTPQDSQETTTEAPISVIFVALAALFLIAILLLVVYRLKRSA